MKRKIWVLMVMVLIPATLACVSQADFYAVEVVLNKPGILYDLTKLENATEVYYEGQAYAYRSHYDDRLIVLISEQRLTPEREKYLSIRLQAPLMLKEVTVHYCTLNVQCFNPEGLVQEKVVLKAGRGSSAVALGTLKVNSRCALQFKPILVPQIFDEDVNLTVSGVLLLSGVSEYRVVMPCLLSLGELCFRVLMLIPGYDAPMDVEPGEYNVTLELSWTSSKDIVMYVSVEPMQGFPFYTNVGKLGWTIESYQGGFTATKSVGDTDIRVDAGLASYTISVTGNLSGQVLKEIVSLLSGIGLNKSLVEACNFSAYRETRLVPTFKISDTIMKNALEAELEWLMEIDVISNFERADIEAIAQTAKLGYAGWNSRLVWDNGIWVPYSSVEGAVLVRCTAALPRFFEAESPEYEQLGKRSYAVAGGAEASQGSRFPQQAITGLALAAFVALAVAGAAYYIIRRRFPVEG